MSTQHHAHYPNVSAAIAAFKAGRPVLLLDDDDREDEADIIAAANTITLPALAFV
ncbi:3,4-dihydroxy-2-butanone-4-phosphate synthase, partial [Citrobacter portucalensis]|nr:3,4-dihydroxy-2-butanone-4-phosphate synthase [Citrobacter portucalensis]